MKDKYIDMYGIDSLINLKEAATLLPQDDDVVFITLNEDMIKDRRELEAHYGVKIRTPMEMGL